MPEHNISLLALHRLFGAAQHAAQTIAASTPLGFSLAVFLSKSRPEIEAYQNAFRDIVSQHSRKDENGHTQYDVNGNVIWADRNGADEALTVLNSQHLSISLIEISWEQATKDAPNLPTSTMLDLKPIVSLP